MAGTGHFTGISLGDTTALCMPWTEINRQLRPAFSREAALLSLELASTAYDLNVEEWRAAGWHDISYQVDNKLYTGSAINGEGGRAFSGALSDYFQRLAQAHIKRMDPISQLRGALRQRDSSDTCKSVVMIHREPGERYVVAIGFMGTGKRIYDWLSNFRLAPEDGMHLGFMQLTREFENNCDHILFPETARELGLEKLSLSDIFLACRRPGSRFRIWMAGHSQGGAIMQLTAFRQIRQGMLKQNLIGYGFASPSVAYENPGCDLESFPLFHIINQDDCVPRVGARLHFGQCLSFTPDAAMRSACYGAAWGDPAFRDVLRLTRRIFDSEAGLLFTLAFLHALESLPDAESVAVLTGVLGRLFPDKLQSALGGRIDVFLRFLIRKTESGYRTSTEGKEVPKAPVEQLRLRIMDLMGRYGARPFVRALLLALSLPHKLRGEIDENGIASYQYIVSRRFDSLMQQVVFGSLPHGGAATVRPVGQHAYSRRRYAQWSAARLRRSGR